MPVAVAIIGAGPLGRWLALSAARAGFPVLLEDVMPANLHHAQDFIRQKAGPSAAATAMASAQDDSINGIAFVSTIEEAVRNADLVIDCVPDELESKLEILWLLDRMAPPRTVLATPTMRLSIADLASCTYRPAKCIAIAAEASALTGKTEGGNLKAETGNLDAPAARPEILLRTTTQTAPETVALLDHFWRQLGFAPRFELDPACQPSS